MKVETKSYFLLLFLVLLWDALFTCPPLLMHLGINADLVYKFFAPVCDQLDARSFHIFGYKLAVCSRCASIYFGFTLGLVVSPLFQSPGRARIPGLLYLAVALAALLVDWGMDYTGITQNTVLSRSITGALLGISISLYALPAFIELAREVVHPDQFVPNEFGNSSQPPVKSDRSPQNER